MLRASLGKPRREASLGQDGEWSFDMGLGVVILSLGRMYFL